MPSQPSNAHVVVVGSGIAGLTVALHAVEHGCRVTLVTKDVLEHANTRYAQGGIAGVMFDDDRIDDHIRDTMVAGAGLNDTEAVRVLAAEGPARIRELVALGVEFDRGSDGGYVKGLEAAHSYPRILHAGGDATGTAIEKALVARLRASDVTVIEHAFLVGLVQAPDAAVHGVDLMLGASSPHAVGTRRQVSADAVVLATGGAGQLYAHTTNPDVATGDGIAAAIRAGARVADLEFVQFHPTVLEGTPGAVGAAGESFLVSEAVRGEGATLVDDDGRRFTFDAHPDGELAPRDVVARAIAHAMRQQGGRPVRLDATALGAEFLARRFPTIDRAVHDRGLDWAVDPIPVTPAAHYVMGGIVTDLFGRTDLPSLYAVGEVARTGVHGANRLASNSLLEGAVFGARAGDVIAADVASGSWPVTAKARIPVEPAHLSHSDLNDATEGRSATGERAGAGADTGERAGAGPEAAGASDQAAEGFTRVALQRLMWADAGLVRDEVGLRRAAAAIARWRMQVRTPRTESQFEDENLLLVAEATVTAALERRESVGAHYRSDAPVPFPTQAEPHVEVVTTAQSRHAVVTRTPASLRYAHESAGAGC